jgi:hypothetical protein
MPAPQEVLAWANALTPAGTCAAPGELPPPIACYACSAGMWIEFDPAWRAGAPPAGAQARTRPAGLGAAWGAARVQSVLTAGCMHVHS